VRESAAVEPTATVIPVLVTVQRFLKNLERTVITPNNNPTGTPKTKVAEAGFRKREK
jgi:hypothetical protein